MNLIRFCLPVLGALCLSACGGGGGSNASAAPQQSGGNGIAVGEPAPGAPAKDAFIKMARESICADLTNRLYVIDGKQVFWHRAGNCPDMSYGYTLFGLTPEQRLCSTSDSIAGPQISCSDESQRALHDTITRNLDKPDLGLGAAHKVEFLPFMPKDGALPFDKLWVDNNASVSAAQTLVLRDAATFQQVWNSAMQNHVPAPAVPQVDFTRRMVLAVFIGTRPNGCYGVAIDKVAVSNGVLTVGYREAKPAPETICTQMITSPAVMVEIDHIDGRVEFVAE